jgi:hypothetical protein
MKMTGKNISQPVEKPAFHKVAENLYRLESSNGHYALLKHGGKQFRQQFRRSLKTKDRKLADRRLNDLRAKTGCLRISPDAKLNFEQAAKLWPETNQHAASSGAMAIHADIGTWPDRLAGMKAYALDLRERVVKFILPGGSKVEAAWRV